jgi:branched-chain amino acid transport system substrate-binding protein
VLRSRRRLEPQLPHHRLAAAGLACVLVAALAGCGSAGGGHDGGAGAGPRPPTTLTVYSDLPVDGPTGASGASGPTGSTGVHESLVQQQGIENGARLALDQWGHTVRYGRAGHHGSFHVYFRPLDDASPVTGQWSQDLVAANVQRAASEPTTVAYIGDFESAATALSLPALSPGGILEVSPWSPYVGFTDPNPADGKGDPGRFYPPNRENDFARLVPSDVGEARAIVRYMRSQGVARLYVLGDVSVFDAAVAQLVANDAPQAGITLVGLKNNIDTQTNSQPVGYAQIVAADVAPARPDAVLLGGTAGVGAIALWQELHAKLPDAKLFAPAALATPAFLVGIAQSGGTCSGPAGHMVACYSAAGATYVTSPILLARQYPASAQAVFSAYRRRFHLAPTAYALYGYAAMEDVLKAIRLTGRYTTDRGRLLAVFFHHLGRIDGDAPGAVIGGYTIDGKGDSSLASFDGYRVGPTGGLVFDRRIGIG